MAIQFARIEILKRSKGDNVCRKVAYNTRDKVKDEKTNEIFDFAWKGGNIFHKILLPEHVDKKFNNIAVFANEIEKAEKRKDSQLAKDIVLALPDNEEITLEDRIEITLRTIDKLGYIKNGLGVQVDIHEPDDQDKNWHAHLLVTTRKFTADGKGFGDKARDLNPDFKTANGKHFIIPEEETIGEIFKQVQNDYFKEKGLDLKVDDIGLVTQKHLGPVRMRKAMSEATFQNNIRKEANIEAIKTVSGLLQRVTKTQSVFSVKDLKQATKEIEDPAEASQLINSVLQSELVLALYEKDENSSAIETGLYTTIEVRNQEEMVLRIAERVNSQFNHCNLSALAKDIRDLSSVSDVQKASLAEILLKPAAGIRILRGRAGTGKSHVLGEAYRLATMHGSNIIGLAPTCKAKTELEAKGFAQSETIKGFLFKLKNGRINLQRNSLIVVDEAGMVGTRDYLELMKVAWSNNCNIILAGDERQLTSVERGGMFEVLAEKFGSFELADIRRQSKSWGREMALMMATGNLVAAIDSLEEYKALKQDDNLQNSMAGLVKDWVNSDFNIEERLIVTVRNQDVDALNLAIQDTLKAKNILTGPEYRITNFIAQDDAPNGEVVKQASYLAKDRIVFTKNYKELGIENGDFGTLTKVSEGQFAVKLDKNIKAGIDKEYYFNPHEVTGFKHGYVSTVYKSQGVSIKDVYILHNRASNLNSSYVQMTRHIEEVKFYYNKEATRTREQLISQLGRANNKLASIKLLSKNDLDQEQRVSSSSTIGKVTNHLGLWLKNLAQPFIDRAHHQADYYKIDRFSDGNNLVPNVQIELVLDELLKEQIHKENVASAHAGQQIPENDNVSIASNVAVTAKAYNVVGGSSNSSIKNDKIARSFGGQKLAKATEEKRSSSLQLKEKFQQEMMQLKMEMKFKASFIAKNILGSHNSKLSNRLDLRFGEHGKVSVRITGDKAGLWYDFSANKGGNLFDLVQQYKNCDFKSAVAYLKDIVGMKPDYSSNLTVIKNAHIKAAENNKDGVFKLVNDRDKDQEKIKSLYQKSAVINNNLKQANGGVERVAARYFNNTRKISCDLGQDVRVKMVFDRNSNQKYPAICAFARNKAGEITGGQTIFLNYKTAQKADIDIPKKSFGKLTGAFVQLQEGRPEAGNITFIAEGLETALSLKQAKIEGKILCSLGVSNLKNYEPAIGEKIIIAADNDGNKNSTCEATKQAQKILQSKGAITEIARPSQIGDFNDVLKEQGTKAIRDIVTPKIMELSKPIAEIILLKIEQDYEANKPAVLTAEELAHLQQIDAYWQGKLGSKDVVYYAQYNEAAGKFKTQHNCLKFEHQLYQSLLCAIAKNNIEAKSEFCAENSDTSISNIGQFLGGLQDMYQTKIEATIAALMQNQHYNEYRELLSDDWTKQALFKTLAADFYLLAQERLKREPGKLHGQKILAEVYNQISSFKADHFGSSKIRLPAKLASEEQVLGAQDAQNRSVHMVREDLSTAATTQLPSEVEFCRKSIDNYDKVTIANKIYKTITSDKWQQDLVNSQKTAAQQYHSSYEKNSTEFKQVLSDVSRLAPELPTKLAGLYQMNGLNAATSEAKILATEVVQSKIERDLQIMQAKWQALQNGGNMDQQQRIVVHDFSGNAHTTDSSYLSALAKDKQLLNYIDNNSQIGKRINIELQAEIHKQRGIERDV